MYDSSTTPIFSCHIACPKCHEYFLRRQAPNYVCPGCGFVHAAESDEDMQEYANSYIEQEEMGEDSTKSEEEILKEQVQAFMGIVKETTDYHAKQDYGKAKLSLVPRRIIWDVAAIREYGNDKYPDGGPDNWKSVEPERYRDAAYRHFLGYLDDPKSVDSESGLPHLWHLACNIAFLCEMEDIYLSKNPEVVERLKKEFWTPVTWNASEDERSR